MKLRIVLIHHARPIIALVAAVMLSGCLLASGVRTSSDTQPTGGNLSLSFVSAEGGDERLLETGAPGTLSVIAIVSVDQGDLRLDLLDPNGSLVFSVSGRPQDQVTRSGAVATDDQGRLRYRVVARGARNGGFQILYQRQESRVDRPKGEG